MDGSISTLLRCAGFTLMGLIAAVIPLFIFLWVVTTREFAISHTVELGLVFGVGYACFQIATSSTQLTGKDWQSIVVFATVVLVLIGGYAWFANHQRSELQNTQAQFLAGAKARAGGAVTKAVIDDSYCTSIGVAYGRGAARSLRGLTVDPKDDIEIPSECRDLPSTNSGIQRGMRQ